MRAGFAVAVLLSALAAACARGPKLDDRPVTLDFDGTPAMQLIQICVDQGGFPVEYDASAASGAAGRPVTVHLSRVPWHEALREIVRQASLATRWERRGDDWVLVVSDAAGPERAGR